MKNYCFTKNVAILIVILTAINSSIADIDNDLLGYWSFDEEDGSTIVYDYSGNENHGTIVDPDRVSGISGDALVLDGVKHYVEIPHSESLHSERGITITGWFFLNEFPPGATENYHHYMALFWKGNRPDCTGPEGCGNREYGLWVRKDGFLVFISTPVDPPKQIGCIGAPTGQLKTGTWYHYGAVVNSNTGTIQVYIDGNLEGENTSYGTTGIRKTYGPLLFGGDEYDPAAWRYPFFDGLIDEIRIYDGALSQGEIQWLYEQQRCMFELLGDVNNDCVFNFLDIAFMAANWLVNCHRTPADPACVYIDPEIPEDKVLIPGGGFEMGDHHGDGFSGELPLHPVLLDAFFMSKFEITNQQYCDYLNSDYPAQLRVEDGIVFASSDSNNSYPYCDTHSKNTYSQIDFSDSVFSVRTKDGRDISDNPMVLVTWYGAVAYCNWRSKEEGKEICYDLATWECDFSKHGYRLPTEAEWEYAARGGDHNPYYRFPWGDTISHSQANYNSYWEDGSPYYYYDVSPTEGYHPYWDYIKPYTAPVGSFQANGYGLYDMSGNVWEWCNDWYDPNYYYASPYDSPEGTANGTYRVLRGGSWKSWKINFRVAGRGNRDPSYRFEDYGIRIVLSADDGPSGMFWVSISDPGVSGHEPFNGQMSKYETSNAQYCQFLNAALASGDIIVDGNDVIGANGTNDGNDFVGEVYYNLAGPGFNFNDVNNGAAARINDSGSSFTVDSGFDNHPVTYVSWYGAKAFCNYYGYRLPTEWEWQAVADYDGSYTYGCGTSINNSIANYSSSTHPDGTTVVGSFDTYGYGICDMAGNVWELTSSLYGSELSISSIRGGGWFSPGSYCKVSFRNFGTHIATNGPSTGFRVCR